jgi:hypothetical protein
MSQPLDMQTYEYTTVQGYVNRGKVARLLGKGWTIEGVTPIQLGGFTLKQSLFLLKRAKP